MVTARVDAVEMWKHWRVFSSTIDEKLHRPWHFFFFVFNWKTANKKQYYVCGQRHYAADQKHAIINATSYNHEITTNNLAFMPSMVINTPNDDIMVSKSHDVITRGSLWSAFITSFWMFSGSQKKHIIWITFILRCKPRIPHTVASSP